MKKYSFLITAVLFSMLFITASVAAQDDSLYLAQEGKQLMEASQYLIDQGQIMEKCNCADKVAMVDKGHMLLRKGEGLMSQAMMMYTDEGRGGNQQVAHMIMEAGSVLIKKGKQAGPLTDKDKAKVNKLGKDMAGLGNTQLHIGKVMCGE